MFSFFKKFDFPYDCINLYQSYLIGQGLGLVLQSDLIPSILWSILGSKPIEGRKLPLHKVGI